MSLRTKNIGFGTALLCACAGYSFAGTTEVDGSSQADVKLSITNTATANQPLGTVNFYGLNGAGSPVSKDYAIISAALISPTSGAETGALSFSTLTTGTLTEKAKINSSGLNLSSLSAGGVVKAASSTGLLSVVSTLSTGDLPTGIPAANIADAYLFNNGDTATGNYNFDSGTFFIDASGNKVGAGTASPTAALHAYAGTSGGGAANIGSVLTLESFDPNLLFQDRSSGNEFAIRYDAPEMTIGKYDGSAYTPLFYFKDTGQLGIGQSPSYALDINKGLRLNETTAPSTPADGVLIYAADDGSGGANLMVHDHNGDVTQLNSHASPETLNAEAVSSFNDPSVPLPFSFHHENAFIGKGEIVDMAKLVKYVEGKMIAELGPQAGKLKWDYDLPADQIRSLEDYQTSQTQLQISRVLKALEDAPPVKVDLGSGKDVPAEAVDAMAETEIVARQMEVTEDVLDLDAMKVVTVTHFKTVREEQPTGRTLKNLKKGWVFKDGQLYRPATLDDINVDAMVQGNPQLPQWILSRISGQASRAKPVSEIISEIKKMRQAKAAAAQGKVALNH